MAGSKPMESLELRIRPLALTLVVAVARAAVAQVLPAAAAGPWRPVAAPPAPDIAGVAVNVGAVPASTS